MTAHPTVGEIVAITTTESGPLLLASRATNEHITGVLLADLATETLQQLRASERNASIRRQLAQAIGQTDDLMSFTVPLSDCAPVERDSSRLGPFEGGDT
jgi:hypothetical protein